MRTYAAAIGGALLATLAVAGWQARTTAPSTAFASPSAWPASGAVIPAGLNTSALGTAALGTAGAAQPTVLRCAPGQQAVVRQAVVDGQIVTAADCAWIANASGYAPPQYAPAQYGVAPAGADIVEYERPRAVPVRYVERAPAPRRVRYRQEKPRRSWQKTALVIGGSAGAGAGVGALAGGKKGALIGAAIGGGAATLFEALKRK